jgi:hypothetical protein
MSKLSFFSCICVFLSTAALAHEEGGNKWEHHMFGGYEHEFLLPGVLNSEFEPKFGPCSELKLDENQKTKLKELYFKFKEGNIDIESHIQKAHLQYEKIVTNLDSTAESAETAGQEIVSAVSGMMLAHANYKNKVMFEILKPQQRHLAHACMMQMFKMRNFSWEKHGEHERSK